MTTYPSSIDTVITLPIVLNNVTTINADAINRLRSAIVAIQTELGVKPGGIYSTVRARLDSIENAVNNIIGVGGSGFVTIAGDIGGTSTNPLVVGLRGHALSSTVPTTGQTLIFDGSAWTPGNNFYSQTLTTTGGVVAGPSILGSVATQLLNLTGMQIFNGITAPLISDPGQAIVYFDSISNKLQISENGGTYRSLFKNAVTLITSNYTILSSDYVISVGTLIASITINLPAIPSTGDTYIIKDANGSASVYNITISGNGKTIDNNTSYIITQSYSSIKFTYNGTKWMSL